MISKFIAILARRAFSKAMRFRVDEAVSLPEGSGSPRRLLYVHIPFCENLCPYCSFNRVLFDESLCREYFKALRTEIEIYRESGYDFQGMYVGGGTPTVLPDELEHTLKVARDSFSIREVSVETNPNHLTDKNLAVLKGAGVNRLSVGVQSFDDGLLKSMGRYDKYGSGGDIFQRLKDTLGYFDTLNADMIFNFPTQTADKLSSDLDNLVETGVDQVTYYPLMVSDSTRMNVNKTLGKVDSGTEKTFYDMIVNRLSPHYFSSSAWCFSRKDAMIDEYIVDYGEYAGLGSGSIGYLGGRCYANTFNIKEYIKRLKKKELPLMACRHFSLKEQVRYDFMMKLFGMELKMAQLEEKYGRKYMPCLGKEIVAFMAVGGLRYQKGTLFLTDRGRYYWVVMMREFFTAVNNFRDFCLKSE
ncbi:MAG: coproporphyrinogen III oxidase family protein [Deltaproteobacteria bacterium]|nr:coproporphyrinogen III oxidase family protein [Deltaproteobacteria bacterium]